MNTNLEIPVFMNASNAGTTQSSAYNTLRTQQTSNENQENFADFIASIKQKQNDQEKQTQQRKEKERNTAPDTVTKANTHNTLRKPTNEDIDDILVQFQNHIQTLLNNAQNSGEAVPTESIPQSEITTDATSLSEEELGRILSLFPGLTEVNIDAKNSDAITKDKNALISDMLSTLQDLSNNKDNALITLNETPESLSKLQDILHAYFKDEAGEKKDELLESLAANFVQLTPPAKESADKQGLAAAQDTTPQISGQTLDNHTHKQDTSEKHFTQERYNQRYDFAATPQNSKNFEDNQDSGNFKNNNAAIFGEKNQNKTSQSIDNNKNAAQHFFKYIDSIAPASFAQPGFAQTTMTTATSTPTNGTTSPLTNTILQNQSAAQAHPATQAVAASIRKIAGGSGDTKIKLQLDPPELGRVEVKMSIDKDNTAKIVLTAEKPETFMMMHRDAHILQRALQDSGLNMSGDGGLSFELSQDQGQSGEAGQHNNQNSSPHKNTPLLSNDESGEVTTTLNLHVDPRTGRMHYNILV